MDDRQSIGKTHSTVKKKALMLASVASMIGAFNIPNIKLLQAMGFQVDVVANFVSPGPISTEETEKLKECLADLDVRIFDVPIPRSINLGAILSSYLQIKKLIDGEQYNIIHCHSPIGGVICRMAALNARQKGTKVIYTAHGFHFYDGAPKKNWFLFYPLEKWMSSYTDVLITINQEDYTRARKRFRAKKIEYIPGVGVDIKKFEQYDKDRSKMRKELDIPENAKLLISVGELSIRKNHKMVVNALNKINDPDLYYVIVGKGELEKDIEQLDTTGRLKLLGYRKDISNLLHAADLFIFPSLQEGLPVALMEAMAAGLPCICTDIRGNRDLIESGKNGMVCEISGHDIATKIRIVMDDDALQDQMRRENIAEAKRYDMRIVEEKMRLIYGED